jgi:hypothetical protein
MRKILFTVAVFSTIVANAQQECDGANKEQKCRSAYGLDVLLSESFFAGNKNTCYGFSMWHGNEFAKIKIEYGIEYSFKNLIKFGLDPFDGNDVAAFVGYNYNLHHCYIGTPFRLNYKILKSRLPFIYISVSPSYLIGGKLSYNKNIFSGHTVPQLISIESINVKYKLGGRTNEFSPMFNLSLRSGIGTEIIRYKIPTTIRVDFEWLPRPIGHIYNCGGDGKSCSTRIYYYSISLIISFKLFKNAKLK